MLQQVTSVCKNVMASLKIYQGVDKAVTGLKEFILKIISVVSSVIV